jgi:hypothetical protein
MKFFQLFTEKPNIVFIETLLACFGLEDLDEKKEFCKEDLHELKTVDKIENLIPELIIYYLPCKSNIYLNNITPKRCITILAQFLKLYDYKLCRKERILNRKKYIYYNIVNNKFNNLHILNQNTELSFL